MGKIQVGYGSDRRYNNPKGCYGKRSSGLKVMNGGFNGAPTVDYTKVSDEQWANIFGKDSLPKWKRELLENGENLD